MLSCVAAGAMLYIVIGHDPDQGVRITGRPWELVVPMDQLATMERLTAHESEIDEYHIRVRDISGYIQSFYLSKDYYPGWTVREFLETCHE